MSDCIFCKIIEGSIPSFKIYEDDDLLAFLDRFPSNLGHVLVIPKKHMENIFDLDEETAAKLMKLVVKVAKHMKDTFGFEGLNILQNNGEAAGQTVNHFHMHLIPRYSNDTVNIKWSSSDIEVQKFEELTNALKF